MKKIILSIPAILIMLVLSTAIKAQVLKLIPNPDSGNGYGGSPVIYNNDLYFTYSPASGLPQLAYYNGDSITLIPSPVSGGVEGPPMIVYNNMLYVQYYNRTTGVYQLAAYDGTTLSLIPNPDATNPTLSFFTIYNNKLCIQYNGELAVYNGTSWTLFSAPVAGGFTYQGGIILYNNKLYMGYETNAAPETRQLLSFNDTVMTLIPNPDGATAFSPLGGGYQGLPIIYNNLLYIKYIDIAGNSQLDQFDGTTETLIANPEPSFGYGDGSEGSPILYNNNLYIQYYNESQLNQLAQYNGAAITLINNPDTGVSTYGYQGAPIVYNNNLYIQYQDSAGVYRLGKFDGITLSLIPNPDASPHGYANYTAAGELITPPIIAPGIGGNEELFIQYENAQADNQLAQYNDTALTLINNPDTSTSSGGYNGSPFIYNDTLFVQYYNATGHYQLAYLSPRTNLPVTLLNFTAQQKGNDNLLQWQTTTEINSSHFNIQRSTDSRNFSSLGEVTAAGNSSIKNSYNYTDVNADKLGFQVLYYRLQMVDKDGKYAYSSIAPVKMSTPIALSVYPNPAHTEATLVFNELAVNNYTVQVTDLQGKTIMELNGESAAGVNNLTFDLQSYPAGTYIITITDQEHGRQSIELNKL